MILLTGANGQLGSDFQKIFRKNNIRHIATGVKELDVARKDTIDNFLETKNIDIIINCAAYNNVDKAETDYEQCYTLNKDAPLYLSEAAKRHNAVFVTYSTDFVFDGLKNSPYKEEDPPNPLSIYGKSKLQGEIEVLNNYQYSFVIRTSWVFGVANKNFNTQVIEWAKKNNSLQIVDDQVSVPTYSYDLAYFSWLLIQSGKFGLYHLSNGSEASRYDQAEYLLRKIGWKGKLGRAKLDDFNLPAKRPKYSKLDSNKLEKTVAKKIPHWENALDRYLENLLEY